MSGILADFILILSNGKQNKRHAQSSQTKRDPNSVLSISWRNIKLFSLTRFLHSLAFTIPIWFVYYEARLTLAQISFLTAMSYAFQVIGELPSGALADLLGRRVVMVLGYLIAALAFFLFPFAQGFHFFIVIGALIGISDSFLSGSMEALVYDSLKQDEKTNQFKSVLLKNSLCYQVGLVISTIAGGFLYQIHQFIPFVLYGACLLMATVGSLWFEEPKIDSEVFTLKNYLKQIKVGTKELFKNSYISHISLFYILVGGISWTFALYFNSAMMVALGFGDIARGVIEGSLRFINIFVLSKLLKSEKFFNWDRSILFFPLMMLLAYLPGVVVDGWIGLPLVAGSMIISTARWVILAQYTNESFQSKYRATAISAADMLIGIVYIAITLVSGPIMENFGGVKTMYSLLGMLSLVTVLPVGLKLIKERRARVVA